MLDPTRDHDIKAVAIGLGRKIARGAGSGGYSALLTTRRHDKAQGLSELVRVGLRLEAALLARKLRTNYASINIKYLIILPPAR